MGNSSKVSDSVTVPEGKQKGPESDFIFPDRSQALFVLFRASGKTTHVICGAKRNSRGAKEEQNNKKNGCLHVNYDVLLRRKGEVCHLILNIKRGRTGQVLDGSL